MTIIFLILFILLAVYAAVLLVFAWGFLKAEFFNSAGSQDYLPFTIIICARNEEKKIARCIKTILDQDYDFSKIQLLLINDASTDKTAAHAEALLKNSKVNHRIITNATQKGKKQSIVYAMQFAGHERIILRDADTFTGSCTWLKCISDFMMKEKADMIIAPVKIADNYGLLWALQAIENNVLTLMSCGSSYYNKPFLASAANLVFTRLLFEKCGSYKNHLHIASGDDVLFLEEAKKIPGVKISWLKSFEAVVQTYPCLNFSALIKQKIRWAGKFSVNPNKFNLMFGILSSVVNAAWLFSFTFVFLVPQNGGLGLIFALCKLLIDILLLFLASRFLKNPGLIWYVLPVGCVYPLYACIVAIASVFSRPQWK